MKIKDIFVSKPKKCEKRKIINQPGRFIQVSQIFVTMFTLPFFDLKTLYFYQEKIPN